MDTEILSLPWYYLLLWYLVGTLHKHKCKHHFVTLAPSPFEPSPLCSAKAYCTLNPLGR